MSTNKHFSAVCAVVLALALIVTVLFMNGEKLGIRVVRDEDAEGNESSQYFTSNDENTDWTATTTITLSGDTATVSGPGAYADGGSVTISAAGYYDVSGTLTDGSLVVDAGKNAKVFIRLNGVSITCSDDAAIRVNQADKVFLTLADGTENALTSGETYSAAALADKTDGAIFSHDDLTINGSGSLTYTAPNSFSAVLVSCPEMQTGSTYTLNLGTASQEVTLTQVAATYGVSGGMGQGGVPGGMGGGMNDRGAPGDADAASGRPGDSDATPPTPPDGDTDFQPSGDLPTRPDGEDSTPGDTADRPTPPDRDSDTGAEPPALPDGSTAPSDQPAAPQGDQTQPAESQPTQTGSFALDENGKWLLVASAAVMALGLGIAILYRKKG